MTAETRASRRSVVATLLSGAVLGGMWGAAFPVFASENRPSMAVVGHKGAQIVLLDSSEARVLLLVGDPDERLFDTLPAMMTLFRQRIDVLVASQPVLLRHVRELQDRWTIRHAISIQHRPELETASIPTTPVTDVVSVSLGANITLECQVSHRREWDARTQHGTSTLWTASVHHPGSRTLIAPDLASLEASTRQPATLLISPDLPTAALTDVRPYGAYACNYDGEGIEDADTDALLLTRIYPQDIARFVLHDEGIDLPPWTYQP
jgi:hypothetical protein